MGAAAGLAIKAGDLHDADLAVRRGRRRYRSAPDQPMLRLRRFERDIVETEAEVLPNDVIDRRFERAQAIVVGAGHVEIHARAAVLIHLYAGHQRPIEALIDEGIEDMGIGVELPHDAAESRIHDRLDGAADLALGVQKMPEPGALVFEPDHAGLALLPAERAAICRLPAAARIERRLRQGYSPRRGTDDAGLQSQGLGMVMAKKMRHRFTVDRGCPSCYERALSREGCCRIGEN